MELIIIKACGKVKLCRVNILKEKMSGVNRNLNQKSQSVKFALVMIQSVLMVFVISHC